MRSIVGTVLSLGLIWQAGAVRAEPWRAVPASTPPAAEQPPPVQLLRPVPLASAAPDPAPVARAAFTASDLFSPPEIIRCQMPDSPAPPPPAGAAAPSFPGAAGGEEAYNCGAVASPAAASSTGIGGFFTKAWDNTKKFFTDAPGQLTGAFKGRALFQSDHNFDSFISPVTDPFFFEDPRALTEVRPIFIWQQTPTQNPLFHGGDNFFVGTQARLAITDWLSFVVNRLGGTWMETDSSTFPSHAGFSEFWLGPKVTFIRSERTGTIMAGGLTFEIPSGPAKVFQNTGSLRLAPYFSIAQRVWRSPWGTVNFLNSTGYNFRTNTDSSEFFYSNFHFDFDVGDLHKIYPLIEMNWFAYTRNGHPQTFGFEGADLFNFGSNNAGKDDLSLSFGARYVVNTHLQFGTAFGWGLLNPTHHLEGFRWTIDMILRY